MNPTVCIYCGSSMGTDPAFRSSAIALTKALVCRGVGIVYGGGTHGLMGDVARTALAAGVPLTGVIPRRFRSDRSVAPEGARYLYVESMQERKETMRSLSDGFVALPGGIGTLDEVTETLMLHSLGFHGKPLALLNGGGFFDPLMQFMRAMTEAGFMKPTIFDGIIVAGEPEALADSLFAVMAAEPH